MMQDPNAAMAKAFMEGRKVCVIATTASGSDKPHAALISFAEDESLCLYFQTNQQTRKAANLHTNATIALVIGADNEPITLQYEGVVEQLKDPSEIAACKQRFAHKDLPTPAAVLEKADTNFYKITPTWMRLSDYSGPPKITELTEF